MKVIGAVGLNGSGKDEAVKYLRDRYQVPLVSVGDVAREIAAKEGVAPTRANLHDISEKYIREFGKDYFMRVIVDRIRENGWKVAGISGIRTPDDVLVLKDSFGEDFVLLHIYVSDPRVRYERIRKRGEARDPQTYEEFLWQDRTEEELFRVKEAIKYADYSEGNDGTLEDLHREVDKLVSEKGLLTT